MKKLYLFALALVGICACLNLSSCKKDDDVSDNSIVGLWGLDSYYENGEFENAIQFNSNGTGVYYDDYPDMTEGAESFTYTFDGKTIIWTWDDDDMLPEYRTETWKVVSISSTKIVYTHNGSQLSLTKIK